MTAEAKKEAKQARPKKAVITKGGGASPGFLGGKQRVVIQKVQPEIDAGRFPIKRVIGESVVVEADVFADGHDALTGLLLYRREKESEWSAVPLEHVDNDRWRASFVVHELGRYRYTLTAWVDHFKSWHRDLAKRITAAQDVSIDLLIGADLIRAAGKRAKGQDAERLAAWAAALQSDQKSTVEKVAVVTAPAVSEVCSVVARETVEKALVKVKSIQ